MPFRYAIASGGNGGPGRFQKMIQAAGIVADRAAARTGIRALPQKRPQRSGPGLVLLRLGRRLGGAIGGSCFTVGLPTLEGRLKTLGKILQIVRHVFLRVIVE